MRIGTIGMKGWKKDNGTWSWTPEVLLEYESDGPILREQQVNDMLAEAEQLKGVIKQMIEGPPEAPSPAPAPVQERPEAPEPTTAPPKAERSAEAPKPAPANPVARTEGPKTIEGFDGERIAAYDRDRPGWNCCPMCGSKDVTHEKKPPKKGTYQACWGFRIWLNAADGTLRTMDEKEVK